jgi:hypothetical protein
VDETRCREDAEEGGVAASYGYTYGWRCRWFPWLPRWWWSGTYGPITPWTPYGRAFIPKEQEIAMLENHRQLLEQTLEQMRKRLEALTKTEE